MGARTRAWQILVGPPKVCLPPEKIPVGAAMSTYGEAPITMKKKTHLEKIFARYVGGVSVYSCPSTPAGAYVSPHHRGLFNRAI